MKRRLKLGASRHSLPKAASSLSANSFVTLSPGSRASFSLSFLLLLDLNDII
jgi:hypothetical protein